MSEQERAKYRIGYLCRQGHFQMDDDPEGDQCGSKDIAKIYVEAEPGIPEDEMREYVRDALISYNQRLEEWRRS